MGYVGADRQINRRTQAGAGQCTAEVCSKPCKDAFSPGLWHSPEYGDGELTKTMQQQLVGPSPVAMGGKIRKLKNNREVINDIHRCA